ncbi:MULTISPECIES: hypothetical protein [Methylobacter]
MKSERFALLECARFYNLFELRHGPEHGGRETNGNKLRDAGKSVFQGIRDCEHTYTSKPRRPEGTKKNT